MKISAENLQQEFGETIALDDVSFDFASGQAHGFIGPNGSGKTTTLRIFAGLLEPTRGDALIDGISAVEYPDRTRPLVGFVPDVITLHHGMTVEDYLDYFARVALPEADEREPRLADVIEFTGLAPILEKEMKALSRGMQQRLALGRELLHEPPVLLLDEPAAGLDPRARLGLLKMLRALAQRGKAILISSHILDELADLCDGVTILERGQVMVHGTLSDIRQRHLTQRLVIARILEGTEALHNHLTHIAHANNPRIEGDAVQFNFTGGDAELAEISQDIHSAGLKLTELRPVNGELSQIYFKTTKGEVQ